jgi:hypothetical protein
MLSPWDGKGLAHLRTSPAALEFEIADANIDKAIFTMVITIREQVAEIAVFANFTMPRSRVFVSSSFLFSRLQYGFRRACSGHAHRQDDETPQECTYHVFHFFYASWPHTSGNERREAQAR